MDSAQMTPCVFCGSPSVTKNPAGQPTCNDHRKKKPRKPSCPVCDEQMTIRDGQYGYFWGCTGYPQCQTTKQINALANQ